MRIIISKFLVDLPEESIEIFPMKYIRKNRQKERNVSVDHFPSFTRTDSYCCVVIFMAAVATYFPFHPALHSTLAFNN